jgi:hypothetical protein
MGYNEGMRSLQWHLPICLALASWIGFITCSDKVTGPNRAPVARAPADRAVPIQQDVSLDGSSSYDPDRDPLTYRWEIVSGPSDDSASIVPSPEGKATFRADVPGVFVIVLTVEDNHRASSRDAVHLDAEKTPCSEDSECANDGEFCNGWEKCIAGTCVFESPDCTDTDPCTDDSCNEATDQCDHTQVCVVDCDNDNQCKDDNACTEDHCNANQKCQNEPLNCQSLDDACNVGACEESQGGCVKQPKTNGTRCGAHTECQGSDLGWATCQAGNCTGFEVTQPCDDGKICNGQESCLYPAGCLPGTPASFGTTCEPDNPSGADHCRYQCLAGLCVPAVTEPFFCFNLYLRGCYSFDGDQSPGTTGGVNDGTTYNNDGTAPTGLSYVAGHTDSALHFPGTASVHIPDSPSLDISNALTIEGWIRAESLPSSGRIGILDYDYQYALFLFYNGQLHCSAAGAFVDGGIVLAQTWTHVACTVDTNNDTMILYQDGKEVARNTGVTGVIETANTLDLVIGGNSPDGEFFVGEIDSVRVFNVARNPDEICWTAKGP